MKTSNIYQLIIFLACSFFVLSACKSNNGTDGDSANTQPPGARAAEGAANQAQPQAAPVPVVRNQDWDTLCVNLSSLSGCFSRFQTVNGQNESQFAECKTMLQNVTTTGSLFAYLDEFNFLNSMAHVSSVSPTAVWPTYLPQSYKTPAVNAVHAKQQCVQSTASCQNSVSVVSGGALIFPPNPSLDQVHNFQLRCSPACAGALYAGLFKALHCSP